MAEKTKTIGIMGGGQLGLMIVEQAHLLGARTLCLDPAPDAPAFALSDGHIVAAYDDAAALEELCRRSDVVTYEFENVPGSVLKRNTTSRRVSARFTIRRIACARRTMPAPTGCGRPCTPPWTTRRRCVPPWPR